MLAITQISHFGDLAIIPAQTYCKQSHGMLMFNTFSRYVMCYTVRRETLEGSNIGEFGKKPSIRQFLNHQCFLYNKRL